MPDSRVGNLRKKILIPKPGTENHIKDIRRLWNGLRTIFTMQLAPHFPSHFDSNKLKTE